MRQDRWGSLRSHTLPSNRPGPGHLKRNKPRRACTQKNLPSHPRHRDHAVKDTPTCHCQPGLGRNRGSKWSEIEVKRAESRPEMGQNGVEMGPKWGDFE